MSLYWLSPKRCVPRDIFTGQSFAVCACWVSCCFAVIPRGFSLFLAAAGFKKPEFPRLSELRSLYFSALSAVSVSEAGIGRAICAPQGLGNARLCNHLHRITRGIDGYRLGWPRLNAPLSTARKEGFAAIYTRHGTAEIVGATAPQAGEIRDLTLAMTYKVVLDLMAETIYLHPTQAEVFQRIALQYVGARKRPATRHAPPPQPKR
jgi:hypothetical protein